MCRTTYCSVEAGSIGRFFFLFFLVKALRRTTLGGLLLMFLVVGIVYDRVTFQIGFAECGRNCPRLTIREYAAKCGFTALLRLGLE